MKIARTYWTDGTRGDISKRKLVGNSRIEELDGKKRSEIKLKKVSIFSKSRG
jgi:hypothetical protein